MNISDRVNSWLSLIANIGILAGLVLVAIELNQSTDQLRLELVFQTTQKLFEINQDLLGDNPNPAIAKSITDPENLTYEEFMTADSFLLNLLNEWEDRFFIHEAGLISDRDWKRHIDENASWTLGYRFAQTRWQSLKSVYEPEFARYVDQALVDIDENFTYKMWLESGFSGGSETSELTQ
jgi:hypothetical protein